MNIFNWKHWNTYTYIKAARKIHGYKYDYSKVIYVNSKTKIKIRCRKHNKYWFVSPSNHLHGTGCPLCAYESHPQNKKWTHKYWVSLARKKHDNQYTYLSPYTGHHCYIRMRHKKCGTVFEQREDSHLIGNGCQVCQYRNLPQNNIQKTKSEFVNQAKKLHGNLYCYSKVDYKGYKTPVKIYCRSGKHYFWQAPYAHLRGQKCNCSNLTSKGERLIAKFLTINFIGFEREKTFEDCRTKEGFYYRFDFYLPNHKVCIEYEGEQHFGIGFYTNEYYYDKAKDRYCNNHNIKIIRIPYYDYDYIESILEDELKL